MVAIPRSRSSGSFGPCWSELASNSPLGDHSEDEEPYQGRGTDGDLLAHLCGSDLGLIDQLVDLDGHLLACSFDLLYRLPRVLAHSMSSLTVCLVRSALIGVASFRRANSTAPTPTSIRIRAVTRSATQVQRNVLSPSRTARSRKISAKKPKTAAITILAMPVALAATDEPSSCLARSISLRMSVEKSSEISFTSCPTDFLPLVPP